MTEILKAWTNRQMNYSYWSQTLGMTTVIDHLLATDNHQIDNLVSHVD